MTLFSKRDHVVIAHTSPITNGDTRRVGQTTLTMEGNDMDNILEEYRTYNILKQPNTAILKIKPACGSAPKSLEGGYTSLTAARRAIDSAIVSMAPRTLRFHITIYFCSCVVF